MQLHVSTDNGTAIYLQIVNQIKYLIGAGRLLPGQELPAIRVLAEQVMVNPNTIARAYRELEQGGFVEKRRTAGTFVSDQGSPLARKERLRIISERIDLMLAEARQMDFSIEEIQKLVQQRFIAMNKSQA